MFHLQKFCVNGSLIIIKPGCQYRPEGWVDLDTVNGSGSGTSGISRPQTVGKTIVKVNEDWWNNWNYRAFNLSLKSGENLNDITADELISSFAIFIPVSNADISITTL